MFNNIKGLAILATLLLSVTQGVSQDSSPINVLVGPPHKSKDYFLRDIISIDNDYMFVLETPSVFSKKSAVRLSRHSAKTLAWQDNLEVSLDAKVLIGYVDEGNELRHFGVAHSK